MKTQTVKLPAFPRNPRYTVTATKVDGVWQANVHRRRFIIGQADHWCRAGALIQAIAQARQRIRTPGWLALLEK